METFSNKNLVWLEAPEIAGLAIERGLVGVDTLLDTKQYFEAFLKELEAVWSPTTIKEYLLEEKRRQYQQTVKHITKLELENRDARVRGDSYKARESFTVKIRTGHQLLREIKQQATEYKQWTFGVRDVVKPLDVPFVQREGFEKHLRYAVLGQFGLST